MEGRFDSPDDLAAWMQEERNTLLNLTTVLKSHIAAMPDAGLEAWLSGLRAGFERLVTHVRRNFEAQESGGYLDMVLQRRPTLSKMVEQCRHEHEELRRLADRISEELRDTRAEDRLLLADLAARIQRYVAVVGQHEQRENMLTMFVFTQDLGGEE